MGFFLGQGFNWGSWGLTHDARGKCHCSAGEKPLLQRLTQTGDPHRPMHHDCPPPGLDCREMCLPGTQETCARWGGRSSPRNLGSRHKITCLLMGCSSPTKLGSQTGFHLQTVRQPRVLGRNHSEPREHDLGDGSCFRSNVLSLDRIRHVGRQPTAAGGGTRFVFWAGALPEVGSRLVSTASRQRSVGGTNGHRADAVGGGLEGCVPPKNVG